jgi:hypothetical protein
MKENIASYRTPEEWEEWWLASVINTEGDAMAELAITDCFFCNTFKHPQLKSWNCEQCYGYDNYPNKVPCQQGSRSSMFFRGWKRIKEADFERFYS